MLKVNLNMRNSLVMAFLALFCFCAPVSSQKQVRIDRTRLAQDRSAKRYAAKQKRNAQASKKPVPKRNEPKEQSKLASYLRVDGYYSNEVTKYVGNKLTILSFDVKTDGNSWTTKFLPSWCELYTKTANGFSIKINENNSFNSRNNWFNVVSDNKTVTIRIRQEARPFNVSASVYDAYIQHNTIQNGNDCMIVSGNFNISNGEDLKFYAVAAINNEYGESVSGTTVFPAYKRNDGKFYAVGETKKNYGSNLHSFNIVIPNAAFYPGYQKKNKLYLNIFLYCENKGEYIPNATYSIPFVAKKKKKGLVTKDK